MSEERSLCPCCGDSSTLLFDKTVLGRHTAKYAGCQGCGSLFVSNPHWLDEAYSLSNRDENDGGRRARADVVAHAVRQLAVAPNARWLDYGAGDGVLEEVLRHDPRHCAMDVVSYDPYVVDFAAEPTGRFDVCSAIEVIEHLIEPADMFRRVGALTDTFIVSVELYQSQGPDWSYLAPAWGQHVTFPTLEGLRACGRAGGFELRRVIEHDMLTLFVFGKEGSAARPRHVVLYNHYHAGDVVMSRSIIQEIVAANPDVSFSLECQQKNFYLWQDLGLSIRGPQPERAGVAINLHFGAFGDSLKDGLTYRNNVETYNRQAVPVGLQPIEYDGKPRFVSLPRVVIGAPHRPSVLVESGPVLSGQLVHDIDRLLPKLADTFPSAVFYHSHPTRARRGTLVDVSNWNLIELSMLSEQCDHLICRLSAVMVASFTAKNHLRTRVVFGRPLGCPIWDEDGLVYADSFGELCDALMKDGLS